MMNQQQIDWTGIVSTMMIIGFMGMMMHMFTPLLQQPLGRAKLERTTVDRVLGDLERTWHRIAPDMNVRMQEALGILKEVMSYYYEEPCVVAWENSDLVGISVYETFSDKDKGVQNTHLKELASFTYTPGVGKSLVEEIVKIGREENSDIVSVHPGPGAKKFYVKLGFVDDVYYPGRDLMMYRLKKALQLYESTKSTQLAEGPRFIMYHATPAENVPDILHRGLVPKIPYHREPSPWAPGEPVIYMSSSFERVKDYAEQAYEMGKTAQTRWAVFRVEYDEFPEEIYPDLMWGVPGTYYAKVLIPPEHLKLIGYINVSP